jgi:hypothetical protein
MLRRLVYFILTTGLTSVIISDCIAGERQLCRLPLSRENTSTVAFGAIGGFERTTSVSATAKTSLQTRMEPLLQGKAPWGA